MIHRIDTVHSAQKGCVISRRTMSRSMPARLQVPHTTALLSSTIAIETAVGNRLEVGCADRGWSAIGHIHDTARRRWPPPLSTKQAQRNVGYASSSTLFVGNVPESWIGASTERFPLGWGCDCFPLGLGCDCCHNFRSASARNSCE
jgi:hypothetical protein